MKKLVPIFLLPIAVCLWAADFWQAKPFADWNDKDVQKMITNSPWAKSISVAMSGPTASMPGGAVAGAGGDGTDPAKPISEGGGGRGGRGGAAAVTPAGGGGASGDVVLRWQSALPVKQALARVKYGAEATTSTEAKEALDRQETAYVIVASGGALRSAFRGDPEAIRKALIDQTRLSVKGKEPLKPADVQVGTSGAGGARGRGGPPPAIEIYFLFPKSTPLTVDDKEVEFATKIGDLALKNKFQLKNMVFNGKLEL
jgi:hypothetical protein